MSKLVSVFFALVLVLASAQQQTPVQPAQANQPQRAQPQQQPAAQPQQSAQQPQQRGGNQTQSRVRQLTEQFAQALQNQNAMQLFKFFDQNSELIYDSILPHGGKFFGSAQIQDWAQRLQGGDLKMQNVIGNIIGADEGRGTSVLELTWNALISQKQSGQALRSQPQQQGHMQQGQQPVQQQGQQPVQQGQVQQRSQTTTVQQPQPQQQTTQTTVQPQPTQQTTQAPVQPSQAGGRALLQAQPAQANQQVPPQQQSIPMQQTTTTQPVQQQTTTTQPVQQTTTTRTAQPVQQQQGQQAVKQQQQQEQQIPMTSMVFLKWNVGQGTLQKVHITDLTQEQALQVPQNKALQNSYQLANAWFSTGMLNQESPFWQLVAPAAELRISMFPQTFFSQDVYQGPQQWMSFFQELWAKLRGIFCGQQVPQEYQQSAIQIRQISPRQPLFGAGQQQQQQQQLYGQTQQRTVQQGQQPIVQGGQQQQQRPTQSQQTGAPIQQARTQQGGQQVTSQTPQQQQGVQQEQPQGAGTGVREGIRRLLQVVQRAQAQPTQQQGVQQGAQQQGAQQQGTGMQQRGQQGMRGAQEESSESILPIPMSQGRDVESQCNLILSVMNGIKLDKLKYEVFYSDESMVIYQLQYLDHYAFLVQEFNQQNQLQRAEFILTTPLMPWNVFTPPVVESQQGGQMRGQRQTGQMGGFNRQQQQQLPQQQQPLPQQNLPVQQNQQQQPLPQQSQNVPQAQQMTTTTTAAPGQAQNEIPPVQQQQPPQQ
jgi:hypothetical protein